ncbi:hypothetical protein IFM89_023395, partial [Coptis chinensis]
NRTFPQSNSISFIESTPRPDRSTDFVLKFRNQQARSNGFGFGNGTSKDHLNGLTLDSLLNKENRDENITLALGTSLFLDKTDLRVLNKQLQENVPWQSEATPLIIEALHNSKTTKNTEIWLLIEGDDWVGKRRTTQGNQITPWLEILLTALRKQERSVVFIEEIDKDDSTRCEGRKKLCDVNVVQMKLLVKESVDARVLEYDHKRIAGGILQTRLRIKERDKGDTSTKKVFSRQSSSNTLDLNILAEEEYNEDEEFKSVPNDLQETATSSKSLNGFLCLIEHRFVFNQKSTQLSQMTEDFMSKLKHSFKEVFGSESKGCFSIDQLVLEEIVNGWGFFLASFLENWLKDIFQTSLQMVKRGGKEGSVRLSLGGKEESGLDTGYMHTNLLGQKYTSFSYKPRKG